jgi:hypothetical protein
MLTSPLLCCRILVGMIVIEIIAGGGHICTITHLLPLGSLRSLGSVRVFPRWWRVVVLGVLGPTAHPGLPLKVFLGVGRC